MLPYNNRLQAAFASMKKKMTIAKSPTGIPSLQTPTWSDALIMTGNIKQNEVAYQITAFNDYGETIASSEFSATLGESLDTIDYLVSDYTPGILPKGVYYYGVTAFNDSGETNIINSTAVKLGGAPHPKWTSNPSSVSTSGGQLPIGTYEYSITTVINDNETDTSTPLVVEVEQDNSIVNLSFKSVEGANKYYIYRRSISNGGSLTQTSVPRRIGQIISNIPDEAERDVAFTDNGSMIGQETAPTFNNTTAGIKISWDKLESDKVKGYKVYGRTNPSASDLKLLAIVDKNTTSYKDQGYIQPSEKSPPKTNESGFTNGAGIELRWDKVPNCTGYNIYGRNKSDENGVNKGFMITISDPNVTTWLDTGLISPDPSTLPPASDTTDGTRGLLGCVVPDGVTLEINQEGLLSVKGGIDSFLGRSLLTQLADKHILIYDEKIAKWINLDLQKLIYDLLVLKSTDEGTVISGIDENLEEYKENLINSLNTLNSFQEEFLVLSSKVEEQAKEIEELKAKIGTPFNELNSEKSKSTVNKG